MVNKKLREMLEEMLDEVVILDDPSFDQSIVGYTTDGRLIYSFDKMVVEWARENKSSVDEAFDFVNSNTCRALSYMGDHAPILILSLPEVGAADET